MKHLQQFTVLMGVMALAALHNPIPIFGETIIAFKGGLSRAIIGGLDVDERVIDARIGIKVGASATIPIQERFGLQLSGNYVQKGFVNNSYDYTLNLDYIELSGLSIVNLVPPGGSASIYMLAGPAVAYNLKCQHGGERFVTDQEGVIKTADKDCKDEIKDLDLGITGGIGTEIAISERIIFSVELLYTLGLLSYLEDEVYPSEVTDAKNRSITLYVGIIPLY